MKNAADGIESISEASGDIISVLKGFSLQSSKAVEIVDIFNEVKNFYLPPYTVMYIEKNGYIGERLLNIA